MKKSDDRYLSFRRGNRAKMLLSPLFWIVSFFATLAFVQIPRLLQLGGVWVAVAAVFAFRIFVLSPFERLHRRGRLMAAATTRPKPLTSLIPNDQFTVEEAAREAAWLICHGYLEEVKCEDGYRYRIARTFPDPAVSAADSPAEAQAASRFNAPVLISESSWEGRRRRALLNCLYMAIALGAIGVLELWSAIEGSG